MEVQRERPPRAALAWAERVLGGEVTRVRAFTGGMTSAVHQLSLRLADGRTRQAVLRRYVLSEVLDDVPDIVEREDVVLRLLDDVELPTPRLLGSDGLKRRAADGGPDVPALLMERLPGRPVWRPHEENWLRGLAEVLPVLHAVRAGGEAGAAGSSPGVDGARAGSAAAGSALPSPDGGGSPAGAWADGVAAFEAYEPERYEPPPWLRRPKLWERALELFQRPVGEPSVLIHRDYHPGNVLWRGGKVSGVVDWQSACAGPPSIDVGWCRLELLQECGFEPAMQFTALWEDLAGATYHPAAEVTLLVDKLGMTHDEPPPLPQVHEELLAKALAALG
ncbi:phosphotransferase family protein [Stackebrandtia nassauensis]|uniref:phosphotransferase family protein n=1 Tax=Stackebrandtia nassauensis TaxID=283811 RepID=UPI001FCA80D7|nr:aminoglycoside phosphotransferase family protein [Stackebrandtia nassauensis]